MDALRLANAIIVDPRHGRSGVGDLFLRDGKVVASFDDTVPHRTIDLTGCVAMPGGIDLHCHIAGPKVNHARRLRPEDRRESSHSRTDLLRSGTGGSTPSSFVTGYLYAGLGYTTAFDAAIAPLGARATHAEFHDVPVVDKGFYVLIGNNRYAMEQISLKEHERLEAFCGWLLNATGGYALKIVNPGGVETWKQGSNGPTGLDDAIPGFATTPRGIVRSLAKAADELKLPHPVHIHCNQLGMPGNWATTLETMKAVEGHRAHFTHIQFHSYGGGPDDQGTFCSKVPILSEYVNTHPNLTVDVGQVAFGETTSMTGDGPLGHYLHRVTGRKWFNAETECEGGCGIVPITYREKSFVHALQWAIGLEWYLLVTDPWRIAMSTDHPNGGAFTAYPDIIALLMNREYRRERLKRLPPKVLERCMLADLDREYSMEEIAVITRAAPARMLGLEAKGHLGVGADADVAVYSANPDRRAMFELPRYVIKAGEVIVDDGEIRRVPFGPTLCAEPRYDTGVVPGLRDWFETNYSLAFDNYSIGSDCFPRGKVVVP
ncbi:MAG: formylmethanofuran dehydrogenase subunit A [Solirubrobacterales bacterium]